MSDLENQAHIEIFLELSTGLKAGTLFELNSGGGVLLFLSRNFGL